MQNVGGELARRREPPVNTPTAAKSLGRAKNKNPSVRLTKQVR